MFDRYKPLDSFDGVGEGKTASVTLQPGVVYDSLFLEFPYSVAAGEEFTSAHITGVRLNLNGEDIIDASAADLIAIEAYESNAETNGRVCISLRELIARTAEGDHATGLVTQKGDAVSLEVDILGTGATAVVTLKGFAGTRAATGPRRFIPKIRKFTRNAGGGGEFQIGDLPKGPFIKRIHFLGQYIDNVIVERDDVKLYDMSKARSEYIQKRYDRVPQANIVHFDPLVDGYAIAKVMRTNAASLVFKLNLTQAGTAHALVESVWPENNPARG